MNNKYILTVTQGSYQVDSIGILFRISKDVYNIINSERDMFNEAITRISYKNSNTIAGGYTISHNIGLNTSMFDYVIFPRDFFDKIEDRGLLNIDDKTPFQSRQHLNPNGDTTLVIQSGPLTSYDIICLKNIESLAESMWDLEQPDLLSSKVLEISNIDLIKILMGYTNYDINLSNRISVNICVGDQFNLYLEDTENNLYKTKFMRFHDVDQLFTA